MQATPSAPADIQDMLSDFGRALVERDLDAVVGLFAEDCYWRDMLPFTWNIKTCEGKTEIRHMLQQRLEDVAPDNWRVVDENLARGGAGAAEGFIRFDTRQGHGYGYIRIRDGRIHTLLTTLESLKGHEVKHPFGAKHGEHQGEPSWDEVLEHERATLGVTTQPYVVVVGAGQNGIMLGAWLRQLEVPTIIVEKHARAGDNWRARYRTLCLHSPLWENMFPFIDLPDNWPVFASKDKFANWLESYASIMDLNIWGNTEAKHCTYDEATRTWSVEVDRNGQRVTLHPQHLVLATGDTGGRPIIPELPGQALFRGTQQHSAQLYELADLKGKKVVVVGSGTSAHDICGDLAQNDIDVTMIQRSSTYVVRSSMMAKYIVGPLFSAEAVAHGITAHKGDMLRASGPMAHFFASQKPVIDKIHELDADFYKGLEDAGFLLDYGPGGSGLFGKAVTGVFNYYIDIGTSQLIIDGKVKLASGSGVQRLTETSVVLEDGREIPADAIIYATGFGFMEGWIADLISPAVAEKVGLVGGFGSGGPRDPGPWLGELRNFYKPTQQEGLWIVAGLIAAGRFYSRFMALQLKARMEGIPTPVYGMAAATPLNAKQRPELARMGLGSDTTAAGAQRADPVRATGP